MWTGDRTGHAASGIIVVFIIISFVIRLMLHAGWAIFGGALAFEPIMGGRVYYDDSTRSKW